MALKTPSEKIQSKKIRQIIELTTFDKLKNLEKKTGFDEAEKSIFF